MRNCGERGTERERERAPSQEEEGVVGDEVELRETRHRAENEWLNRARRANEHQRTARGFSWRIRIRIRTRCLLKRI